MQLPTLCQTLDSQQFSPISLSRPKVLRSIEEGLELPPCALKRSWDSLDQAGHLSSASVLFVLADLLQANEAEPEDYALMLALGPGFCLELVLLQW